MHHNDVSGINHSLHEKKTTFQTLFCKESLYPLWSPENIFPYLILTSEIKIIHHFLFQ